MKTSKKKPTKKKPTKKKPTNSETIEEPIEERVKVPNHILEKFYIPYHYAQRDKKYTTCVGDLLALGDDLREDWVNIVEQLTPPQLLGVPPFLFTKKFADLNKAEHIYKFNEEFLDIEDKLSSNKEEYKEFLNSKIDERVAIALFLVSLEITLRDLALLDFLANDNILTYIYYIRMLHQYTYHSVFDSKYYTPLEDSWFDEKHRNPVVNLYRRGNVTIDTVEQYERKSPDHLKYKDKANGEVIYGVVENSNDVLSMEIDLQNLYPALVKIKAKSMYERLGARSLLYVCEERAKHYIKYHQKAAKKLNSKGFFTGIIGSSLATLFLITLSMWILLPMIGVLAFFLLTKEKPYEYKGYPIRGFDKDDTGKTYIDLSKNNLRYMIESYDTSEMIEIWSNYWDDIGIGLRESKDFQSSFFL